MHDEWLGMYFQLNNEPMHCVILLKRLGSILTEQPGKDPNQSVLSARTRHLPQGDLSYEIYDVLPIYENLELPKDSHYLQSNRLKPTKIQLHFVVLKFICKLY